MHCAMRVAILLLSLLVLVTGSHGFLFYKKSAPATQAYSVRSEQYPPWPIQPPPQFDSNGQITVAFPVAVPIQAQMAPAGPIAATPIAAAPIATAPLRNFQLVPCLCPVAKDIDGLPPNGNPSGSYVVQSSSSSP